MAKAAEPDPSPRQNTLDVIDCFNRKDISTPIAKYCSDDYIFECTQSDGALLKFDKTQMHNLREWYFFEHAPLAHASVRSVATSIERETATVYVTLLMYNDDASGHTKEKLSIFFWRLEEMKNGEKRWVWTKEYTSAGVVSFDQSTWTDPAS